MKIVFLVFALFHFIISFHFDQQIWTLNIQHWKLKTMSPLSIQIEFNFNSIFIWHINLVKSVLSFVVDMNTNVLRKSIFPKNNNYYHSKRETDDNWGWKWFRYPDCYTKFKPYSFSLINWIFLWLYSFALCTYKDESFWNYCN